MKEKSATAAASIDLPLSLEASRSKRFEWKTVSSLSLSLRSGCRPRPSSLAEREPMRSSTRGREKREGNPISLKHAPAGPLRGHFHMTSALRKGDILSEFVTDKGGEGPKILKC